MDEIGDVHQLESEKIRLSLIFNLLLDVGKNTQEHDADDSVCKFYMAMYKPL